MAALGTNDLKYLGVSEGRFAEIQTSIWSLVLPTTGSSCSFVAKRGRRGSMILAKNHRLGGGPRINAHRMKRKVGSMSSLPDGDKEEKFDALGLKNDEVFSTPEMAKADGGNRLVIGGSGDARHTASKFGKTPKYGKTPGASRLKAAAQNRTSSRFKFKSTMSLENINYSPSTLTSPTTKDIQSSESSPVLSPSMTAILFSRQHEIASKKYHRMVQERRDLQKRLHDLESSMLECAVRVLVRRWRMKREIKSRGSS